MRWLAIAVPALGLLGCKTIPPLSAAGLNPTQVALVQRICTDTMGLRSGSPQFDACRDSLADSLHRHAATQTLERAHASCEEQGFAPGSSELASCVVLAQQRNSPAIPDTSAPSAPSASASPARVLPDEPPVPRISFYKMSRPVRHEREQLACAQLGIDPITPEFRDCVSEMLQAFWDLENPL
jgi:hypothetical protein